MSTDTDLKSGASMKPHHQEYLRSIADAVAEKFPVVDLIYDKVDTTLSMAEQTLSLKRKSIKANPLMFHHKGYGLV